MHIAALQGAAAVVLGDQAVAVVDEPGGVGAAGDLVEPPERVVGEAGVLGAARADQAVLGVVAERGGPVRGQVAVGIPGMADTPDLGVLVAAVDRITLGRAGDRVLVGVVAEAAGNHLAGRVVRKPERRIVGSPGAVQVVGEQVQPRDRVIAIAGDGPGRIALEEVTPIEVFEVTLTDLYMPSNGIHPGTCEFLVDLVRSAMRLAKTPNTSDPTQDANTTTSSPQVIKCHFCGISAVIKKTDMWAPKRADMVAQCSTSRDRFLTTLNQAVVTTNPDTTKANATYPMACSTLAMSPSTPGVLVGPKVLTMIHPSSAISNSRSSAQTVS